MANKHAELKLSKMLHGADYNPEQWPEDTWPTDMELFAKAHCNVASVGVFSWAKLEPEEGRFEFDWLDRVMDMLADNGMRALLATPSGAKPNWMAHKYPEIRKVMAKELGYFGSRQNLGREPQGIRHNHCRTSPVYREKTQIINRKLAERYKDHPALLMWHVSNESDGGECYCDFCLAAFRDWLRDRYDNDLDKLNHAWWTTFWGHVFTDWDHIAPVDLSIRGMELDWRRFISDQVIDFFKSEIEPLREITPNVPVTTNFMSFFPTLDYFKFASEVDVVSWDCYPDWHAPEGNIHIGQQVALDHDLFRSLRGGQPFLLMESAPGAVQWRAVNKLDKPGMHRLAGLQAVAHGSESVQYFQFRKGRGSAEQFHGAIVDHVGTSETRVFKSVADLGECLEKLAPVIGSRSSADVAIMHDWDSRWSLEYAGGLGRKFKEFMDVIYAHHRPFWLGNIATDIVNGESDWGKYKLIIAPMMAMLHPGQAERIKKFVSEGGSFVTTYLSGIYNESTLTFLGGFPGDGLREVFGIWNEEIDALHPSETNSICFEQGNSLGLAGKYSASKLCGLIHAEGAEVLATYGDDFYAGQPAVTCNSLGDGKAVYIASNNDADFLAGFYGALASQLAIAPTLSDMPEGVSVTKRSNGSGDFYFVMNFNDSPQVAPLPEGQSYVDLLTGQAVADKLELTTYGVAVLK